MTWQSNLHLMHYKVHVHSTLCACNPRLLYKDIYSHCVYTTMQPSLETLMSRSTLMSSSVITSSFRRLVWYTHTYTHTHTLTHTHTHTHTHMTKHTYVPFLSLIYDWGVNPFLCTFLQHIGPPSVLKSLIERVSQH